MSLKFTPAALPGVTIIEPEIFADERGYLMETYKRSEFVAAGLAAEFVQENHSRSVHGTLRGLHLQCEPKAQAKLVRVIEGAVFDVVADVRRGSPTFGQWVGVTLSAENRRLLFVPAGYAHGFCVTSAEAQVVYKMTAEYAPELERGVRWDDPVLGINWPVSSPRLSPRDSRWPALSEHVGDEQLRPAPLR
ncbi:MAG TPA: dTDP-4-dehydrorhamnose 3,5-epimerase [Vicinamibacterales bacterium]|nr:dTDP-4-dehydrorhamnose 3,5-epimerase [Vicinamibacterales bacterium]